MKRTYNHSFDIAPQEAIHMQNKLSKRVITYDCYDSIEYIAGVDVHYSKTSESLTAAAVLVNASSFEIVEVQIAKDLAKFPYIPGLFSFREAPAICKALEKLKNAPDLIFCDGHGIAHPRKFGLACHIGILFDIPTIGCAKNNLVGKADTPDLQAGSYKPIRHNNATLGYTLRTKENVKPVYISIGHKISAKSIVERTLDSCTKFRLPQPIRFADQYSKKHSS